MSTGLPSIKDSERLRVGIFLERRHIAHPWQEHAWHAAGIAPGAPELAAPRLLQQGPGWARYHMATLDIELFPGETEGYRYNLSQQRPVVYVLWRHAAGLAARHHQGGGRRLHHLDPRRPARRQHRGRREDRTVTRLPFRSLFPQ